MASSSFQTHPVFLKDLLQRCDSGKLQLPDFQRSWVWDEDRIKSLVASISRGFPVGAVMTLQVGGGVEFKPRMIEGAKDARESADALLLDGQQRLTSMYQVAFRQEVVHTVTPSKKRVDRFFYIDMNKALDPSVPREEAIVGVPADKIIRTDFGRTIHLDLTTRENEIRAEMFPVNLALSPDDWLTDFDEHYFTEELEIRTPKNSLKKSFKSEVLDTFMAYAIPVIELDKETSKEAVCVVFEKVNTGGKPLDAFELITAIYAADGHELRKDWYGDKEVVGRAARFTNTFKVHQSEPGILSGVSNTDFLQVISLFHTRDKRNDAVKNGRIGKELPAISSNRAALLGLPLDAYKKYEELAEEGFTRAAQFLRMLHVFRPYDLPYQSQVVPLAAILADLGEGWDTSATRERVSQWYWNGVFGELYGSSTETRIAKDFVEVVQWVRASSEIPSTITDSTFRADRLLTMRMRLSAAYKGVNALLMNEGAVDFRTGKRFEYTLFFDESVDIHHIFPQKWCEDNKIEKKVYDSIINKTPISSKTNRMIGGAAPSVYLETIENRQLIASREALDDALKSHLINVEHIRSDSFHEFMRQRQRDLITLIESATGKAVYQDGVDESGEYDDSEIGE
jgi:hypothetical protein